jgi:hypothetical protein
VRARGGIEELARTVIVRKGIDCVILATDGDLGRRPLGAAEAVLLS